MLINLKGFSKLSLVDEALKKFLIDSQIETLPSTRVPLSLAHKRVLAEDVIAEEDLPKFDRSAVDGYAVKAEDTFGATLFNPTKLIVIKNDRIHHGQTKLIWTGSPLPKGANAVVMLEHARQIKNQVEVTLQLTPGRNVLRRGEEIRKGEIAAKAGVRLKPQHLGMIASLGIKEVKVVKKPKIAILATGDELINSKKKAKTKRIFEVNRIILTALCNELNTSPADFGIVKDDITEIVTAINRGLETADAIITTGGTSVGLFDYVPQAIEKIDRKGIVAHGIAMRPAMPTALAIVKKKPIVMLPGNPVAAMIGFEVFVRPLIQKLQGLEKEEGRPTIQAKLTKRVNTVLGRKTYVRVHVIEKNGEIHAIPISTHGSSLLSTMTKATGYFIAHENREGVKKGENVKIHLFDTY